MVSILPILLFALITIAALTPAVICGLKRNIKQLGLRAGIWLVTTVVSVLLTLPLSSLFVSSFMSPDSLISKLGEFGVSLTVLHEQGSSFTDHLIPVFRSTISPFVFLVIYFLLTLLGYIAFVFLKKIDFFGVQSEETGNSILSNKLITMPVSIVLGILMAWLYLTPIAFIFGAVNRLDESHLIDHEKTPEIIDSLCDVSDNFMVKSLCALSDNTIIPLISTVRDKDGITHSVDEVWVEAVEVVAELGDFDEDLHSTEISYDLANSMADNSYVDYMYGSFFHNVAEHWTNDDEFLTVNIPDFITDKYKDTALGLFTKFDRGSTILRNTGHIFAIGNIISGDPIMHPENPNHDATADFISHFEKEDITVIDELMSADVIMTLTDAESESDKDTLRYDSYDRCVTVLLEQIAIFKESERSMSEIRKEAAAIDIAIGLLANNEYGSAADAAAKIADSEILKNVALTVAYDENGELLDNPFAVNRQSDEEIAEMIAVLADKNITKDQNSKLYYAALTIYNAL